MNENNQSISFEIQQTLPILHWTQYPSNPYARHVSPDMLTENGLQVIDTIGSRNSATPVSQRTKAVYVFDQNFVVASIRKLFEKLQCEPRAFINLCYDAAGDTLADDDDSVTDIPFEDSPDFALFQASQDELATALAIIQTFKDELSSFRALLPSPNDKGDYPVRYTKAVLLLEKLENIFKYDFMELPETMTIEDVKIKLARC